MSVLNPSAHVLCYKCFSSGYEDTETGDFIKGTEYWIDNYCRCDITPPGKADVITLPNGETTKYSYVISNLPFDCRDFKYGDIIRIKLYGDSDSSEEFTVKGFFRYQHQCKIWV